MSIFMMINPPSLRHVAGTARPVRPPRWPWAGEATTPRWGPRRGRQTRTCLCWGRIRASTPPCLKDARLSSHRTSTNFPRLPPLPRHTNDKVAISNILPIRIIWTLLSIYLITRNLIISVSLTFGGSVSKAVSWRKKNDRLCATNYWNAKHIILLLSLLLLWFESLIELSHKIMTLL